MTDKTWKRWGAGTAFAASGLVAGAVLAGSLTANAATNDTSTTPSSPPAASRQGPLNPGDPTKAQRPDEHLLTGDTAAKVRAAALGKYPGATVLRVESDSDGVYEAHLVTKAGTPVTVEVDKTFAVTGTESMPAPGQGGPGGPPPAGATAPAA